MECPPHPPTHPLVGRTRYVLYFQKRSQPFVWHGFDSLSVVCLHAHTHGPAANSNCGAMRVGNIKGATAARRVVGAPFHSFPPTPSRAKAYNDDSVVVY